ncbi:MAG: peptidoglycan DD-metalloendopeptidase family protein [Bacteroidales bacterium]|nr:peptidoglycan DD-metalloendopeptidase family protein [Bacteroidales bacterium]
MKKFTSAVLFCLMLVVTTMQCFAQSKDDLQSKVKQLEKDIMKAEKLLKETSKNKAATVSEVNLLQTQISQRETLIKTYKQQVSNLDKSIKRYRNDIDNLQDELENHRQEYADMLNLAYKNRSNIDNLLFIFSSDDFSQAVRRMRYIREFNESLKGKMTEIDSTKSKIKNRLTKNEADKEEKQQLLAAQEKEKDLLVKDKKKLDEKVAKLKKQEGSIKKDIQAKNKESEALQKKIRQIIESEAKKAREREAAAKSKNKTSVDYQLSTKFENNKGKLPWPCDGIVTGKYGNSQHPTQSKVTINNHGIDITTTAGSMAYCVFDGEVSTVFNTGKSNVVMVRHGLYFTLYANLDKVFVKSGDKVKTGDKIGVVHTSATENTTVLHFELWNDKNHTNPKNWLKP